MFGVILDEIKKAAEQFSRDDVLDLAPIYLFRCEDMTSDMIVEAGDCLTEQLESEGFFDVLHDAFVMLNVVSQHTMSERTQFSIGLCDCWDNFAYTLSEWMNLLSVNNKIQKGVILISIDDVSVLRENAAWWTSLMRTVRYCKRSFIFIFAVGKDMDKLKADISRLHNCVELPEYRPQTEKLAADLTDRLLPHGYTLSDDAEKAVTELIDRLSERISPNQVRLWANHILWKLATSQRLRGEPLGSEELDMKFLEENTVNDIGERDHMGFKG